MPFILEGIVTTRNEDGTINVAPMGPVVDPAEAPRITNLLLRPFQTSTTYANLARTRQGVFHVTDASVRLLGLFAFVILWISSLKGESERLWISQELNGNRCA